jgi:disulfide bond formation protein DsbB
MSEFTIKTYEYWREASQRFDYFVTGITGALCAYIIQHFIPQRLSFSPYLLELSAVLFLLASFIVGLRQIEHKVVLLKCGATKAEKSEMYSELSLFTIKGSAQSRIVALEGKN